METKVQDSEEWAEEELIPQKYSRCSLEEEEAAWAVWAEWEEWAVTLMVMVEGVAESRVIALDSGDCLLIINKTNLSIYDRSRNAKRYHLSISMICLIPPTMPIISSIS
jgi:hypothetical protein